MEGQLSHQEAERRIEQLVTLLQGQGRRKNERELGATVEVLVEGVSKYDAQHAMGRTRTHKIVNIAAGGAPPAPGSLVPVLLESCTSTSFRGELAG